MSWWRRWLLRRRLRFACSPVPQRERDQMVAELCEVVDRVERM